jgi:hypothetical protein
VKEHEDEKTDEGVESRKTVNTKRRRIKVLRRKRSIRST